MLGPVRTFAIAALALAAGGCGFTPMYAQPQVRGGLKAISIATPDTRTGYLLREELTDELGIDRAATPKYHLAVAIAERRRPRGLNPDDTPTRYELRLDVSYTLTDVHDRRVLLKETRPVFISSVSVVQPYSQVTAQQDSQERAAMAAAQIIRNDVALVLSGK
jgi:LPS-assembly lipoprotein